MAQAPFLDVSTLDLDHTVLETDEVRALLPQRHELAMVDRFVHIDPVQQIAVAVKDLREDDWWCKAHFPGNPILPGILMIEGAAQVGSVLWKKVSDLPDSKLIGFGGVEEVRFRGQVRPPARLVYIASGGRFRSRLAWLPLQVLVDDRLVFEGTILGASI